MIQVGIVKGYTILYDEKRKLFILEDADGNEVASGATQNEVEAKAEKLSKQAFNFPIPALKVTGLDLSKGRVTSFNADTKSAYFAYDDKRYGSHQKLRLKYDHAYELTEANSRIHEQVEQYRNQIKEIEEKISSLIDQLEKRIDLSYFGLKELW
ncbi:unnamed protein product [marine sediment metagenome]|uniref:Uncharacterized protein n=1 Tax=marine sediment metagenome TaxID=412755 RepID=X1TEK5_9ZZZZ